MNICTMISSSEMERISHETAADLPKTPQCNFHRFDYGNCHFYFFFILPGISRKQNQYCVNIYSGPAAHRPLDRQIPLRPLFCRFVRTVYQFFIYLSVAEFQLVRLPCNIYGHAGIIVSHQRHHLTLEEAIQRPGGE